MSFSNNNSEASPTEFADLSLDLQGEIIARVASSSLADYYNMMLSCKKFRDLGTDDFIYGRVCVDRIPITAWHGANGRVSLFIHRCLENDNPEALFRQAMVEYFCWDEIETACEYLNSAANLNHNGVYYIAGIMYLFQEEDYKDNGIKMLSTILKTSCAKESARCRKLLTDLLRSTKIQNLDVLYYRPICCDKTFHGYCDACYCDIELSRIFNVIDANPFSRC